MRRAVHIVFAGLLAVMVGMVGVGSYGLSWAGTLTCCCGDHSVIDDCGCPSCPASAEEDDEEVSEDRLNNCGGATIVAPSQVIKLVSNAESGIVISAPAVRIPLLPDVAVAPPYRTQRPDVPDS